MTYIITIKVNDADAQTTEDIDDVIGAMNHDRLTLTDGSLILDVKLVSTIAEEG